MAAAAAGLRWPANRCNMECFQMRDPREGSCSTQKWTRDDVSDHHAL